MSTKAVHWEDPPMKSKRGGRTPVWAPLLLPLMDHPKRWALIRTYNTPHRAVAASSKLRATTRLTAEARNGKNITYLPPGRWEFTARTVEEKGHLYARYLGEADE